MGCFLESIAELYFYQYAPSASEEVTEASLVQQRSPLRPTVKAVLPGGNGSQSGQLCRLQSCNQVPDASRLPAASTAWRIPPRSTSTANGRRTPMTSAGTATNAPARASGLSTLSHWLSAEAGRNPEWYARSPLTRCTPTRSRRPSHLVEFGMRAARTSSPPKAAAASIAF